MFYLKKGTLALTISGSFFNIIVSDVSDVSLHHGSSLEHLLKDELHEK